MTSAHEFFEWAGAVAGDLAVVAIISAWWTELWANNAHVAGIAIILGIGVFRLVSSYYTARWTRWRWRNRKNEP